MEGEDRTQLYLHIKSVGLEFAGGIGSSWKISDQYSAAHKNPLLKLLRNKQKQNKECHRVQIPGSVTSFG